MLCVKRFAHVYKAAVLSASCLKSLLARLQCPGLSALDTLQGLLCCMFLLLGCSAFYTADWLEEEQVGQLSPSLCISDVYSCFLQGQQRDTELSQTPLSEVPLLTLDPTPDHKVCQLNQVLLSGLDLHEQLVTAVMRNPIALDLFRSG